MAVKKISDLIEVAQATTDDKIIINTPDGSGGYVTRQVPLTGLPSYVDDIIEGYYYNETFYEDAEHTIGIIPEEGKIYVDKETNYTYRWSGSIYVQVGGEEQQQANWNQYDDTLPDYVKNRPFYEDNIPNPDIPTPVYLIPEREIEETEYYVPAQYFIMENVEDYAITATSYLQPGNNVVTFELTNEQFSFSADNDIDVYSMIAESGLTFDTLAEDVTYDATNECYGYIDIYNYYTSSDPEPTPPAQEGVCVKRVEDNVVVYVYLPNYLTPINIIALHCNEAQQYCAEYNEHSTNHAVFIPASLRGLNDDSAVTVVMDNQRHTNIRIQTADYSDSGMSVKFILAGNPEVYPMTPDLEAATGVVFEPTTDMFCIMWQVLYTDSLEQSEALVFFDESITLPVKFCCTMDYVYTTYLKQLDTKFIPNIKINFDNRNLSIGNVVDYLNIEFDKDDLDYNSRIRGTDEFSNKDFSISFSDEKLSDKFFNSPQSLRSLYNLVTLVKDTTINLDIVLKYDGQEYIYETALKCVHPFQVDGYDEYAMFASDESQSVYFQIPFNSDVNADTGFWWNLRLDINDDNIISEYFPVNISNLAIDPLVEEFKITLYGDSEENLLTGYSSIPSILLDTTRDVAYQSDESIIDDNNGMYVRNKKIDGEIFTDGRYRRIHTSHLGWAGGSAPYRSQTWYTGSEYVYSGRKTNMFSTLTKRYNVSYNYTYTNSLEEQVEGNGEFTAQLYYDDKYYFPIVINDVAKNYIETGVLEDHTTAFIWHYRHARKLLFKLNSLAEFPVANTLWKDFAPVWISTGDYYSSLYKDVLLVALDTGYVYSCGQTLVDGQPAFDGTYTKEYDSVQEFIDTPYTAEDYGSPVYVEPTFTGITLFLFQESNLENHTQFELYYDFYGLTDLPADKLMLGDGLKSVDGKLTADVNTYAPFPDCTYDVDNYCSNGTIHAASIQGLINVIQAFPDKAQGRAYYGEIINKDASNKCLPPELGNVEATISFNTGDPSYIAVVTLFSSNAYPYHWELNTASSTWRPLFTLPNTKPNDFNSKTYDVKFVNGQVQYVEDTGIDALMSTTSTNPVQNKAVTQYLAPVLGTPADPSAVTYNFLFDKPTISYDPDTEMVLEYFAVNSNTASFNQVLLTFNTTNHKTIFETALQGIIRGTPNRGSYGGFGVSFVAANDVEDISVSYTLHSYTVSGTESTSTGTKTWRKYGPNLTAIGNITNAVDYVQGLTPSLVYVTDNVYSYFSSSGFIALTPYANTGNYTFTFNGSAPATPWEQVQADITALQTDVADIQAIVECPTTTDGTYTLQATVVDGQVTYQWVATS